MSYCNNTANQDRAPEGLTSSQRMVLFAGDCLKLLEGCPDEVFQLVVTSPPYNLGKEYETKLKLHDYVEQQRNVIRECVRTLRPTGSICWQVGNYVDNGCIVPLDTVLYGRQAARDSGTSRSSRSRTLTFGEQKQWRI